MKKNKVLGIILAGGIGSRLYPMSSVGSKHFLSIYDKPMIFYPLSVLMLAGIRDFVIVTQSKNVNTYKKILKNSKSLGISIKYKIQNKPLGIAHGLKIGSKNGVQTGVQNGVPDLGGSPKWSLQDSFALTL